MADHGDRLPCFFADANADCLPDEAEGRIVAFDGAAAEGDLLLDARDLRCRIRVHNPLYALELLHESIESLAGPLEADCAQLGLRR